MIYLRSTKKFNILDPFNTEEEEEEEANDVKKVQVEIHRRGINHHSNNMNDILNKIQVLKNKYLYKSSYNSIYYSKYTQFNELYNALLYYSDSFVHPYQKSACLSHIHFIIGNLLSGYNKYY